MKAADIVVLAVVAVALLYLGITCVWDQRRIDEAFHKRKNSDA